MCVCPVDVYRINQKILVWQPEFELVNAAAIVILIRAGHFGFSVLQCSSESYFQVNLAMKITYFWARPIKKNLPHSNSLIEDARNSNNRKCPALYIFVKLY